MVESSFSVSHSQALWILQRSGVADMLEGSGLEATVKAWRVAGIPFGTTAPGQGSGSSVLYDFDALFELAVALALYRDGLRPRALVPLITGCREEIRRVGRIVWTAVATQTTPTVWVGIAHLAGSRSPEPQQELVLAGHFLVLDLAPSPGGSGPPVVRSLRLLGPAAALKRFCTLSFDARHPLIVPLTPLVEGLLRLAAAAPAARRGRPPGRRAANLENSP